MYNDYVNVNKIIGSLGAREEEASYNYNDEDLYYNESIINYNEVEL